jgi:hypothetical protein
VVLLDDVETFEWVLPPLVTGRTHRISMSLVLTQLTVISLLMTVDTASICICFSFF